MSKFREAYTNHAHFAMYEVWETNGHLFWDYLNSGRKKKKLVEQTPAADWNTIARDCADVQFEQGVWLGLQDIEALGVGRHGIITVRKCPWDMPYCRELNMDLLREAELRKKAGLSTTKCPVFRTRLYQFGLTSDSEAEQQLFRRSIELRFYAITNSKHLEHASPAAADQLFIRARNLLVNGTVGKNFERDHIDVAIARLQQTKKLT